jgi:hypothetical protein
MALSGIAEPGVTAQAGCGLPAGPQGRLAGADLFTGNTAGAIAFRTPAGQVRKDSELKELSLFRCRGVPSPAADIRSGRVAAQASHTFCEWSSSWLARRGASLCAGPRPQGNPRDVACSASLSAAERSAHLAGALYLAQADVGP